MISFIPGSLGAVLLAFSVFTAQAEEATAGQNPRKQTFSKELKKTVAADYLLFLPAKYETEKTGKWPLIIFLHGAGERGSDVARTAVHGPLKWAAKNPEFPFIVASPQTAAGKTWDADTVLALKDELLSKHQIDPERVYLTGLSMGGYGSWDVLTANPKAFAAYAPICGGGQPIRIWLGEGKYREALGKAPVWAFHGAKDSVVPVAESERMIAALKAAGNEKAKLTIYPDAGHDSWSQTYANQELYDWFLRHKLEPK